ncbi:hypothetical protein EG68_05740 [Paragonimus skrjabini miyazakii]|uniref:BHLH domain-containing protein n=1 Tax=Paragonimus skrjabini miyazakii TaxID=59628 RepID=A0A8S9YU88_9TREM|nr:hypothetical protein EG68_05740 [Paragonimus skrjabini miyazakii]
MTTDGYHTSLLSETEEPNDSSGQAKVRRHERLLWTNASRRGKRMEIVASTKPRRPRATMRERQRMAQVNQAFDSLRSVVPRGHMTEYQRLSKIATLRLAIQYIRAMNRILGKDTDVRNGLSDEWSGRFKRATRRIQSTTLCECTDRGTTTFRQESIGPAGAPDRVHDRNKTLRSSRTRVEEIKLGGTVQEEWLDIGLAENRTFVLFGCSPQLGWDMTELDFNNSTTYRSHENHREQFERNARNATELRQSPLNITQPDVEHSSWSNADWNQPVWDSNQQSTPFVHNGYEHNKWEATFCSWINRVDNPNCQRQLHPDQTDYNLYHFSNSPTENRFSTPEMMCSHQTTWL